MRDILLDTGLDIKDLGTELPEIEVENPIFDPEEFFDEGYKQVYYKSLDLNFRERNYLYVAEPLAYFKLLFPDKDNDRFLSDDMRDAVLGEVARLKGDRRSGNIRSIKDFLHWAFIAKHLFPDSFDGLLGKDEISQIHREILVNKSSPRDFFGLITRAGIIRPDIDWISSVENPEALFNLAKDMIDRYTGDRLFLVHNNLELAVFFLKLFFSERASNLRVNPQAVSTLINEFKNNFGQISLSTNTLHKALELKIMTWGALRVADDGLKIMPYPELSKPEDIQSIPTQRSYR